MDLHRMVAAGSLGFFAAIASDAIAQPFFDPRKNVEIITELTPELTGRYTANRITLDFVGQLTGVCAALDVHTGDGLYNEHDLGSEDALPPREAAIEAIPNLAYDSFITVGGYTRESWDGMPLIVGSTSPPSPPSEDPCSRPYGFSGADLSVAWATPPGNAPADQANYPIAQFTLANNTNGVLHLFVSAAGQGFGGAPLDSPAAYLHIPVVGGAVGIPEPSSVVLGLLVAFAAVVLTYTTPRQASLPNARTT